MLPNPMGTSHQADDPGMIWIRFDKKEWEQYYNTLFSSAPDASLEGDVGVDEHSRFRVVNGDKIAIEHYPWPYKAPHRAVLAAWDVVMWHIRMIHQQGSRQWNKARKL